ncbi:putative thymidine phosphorylase [Thalassobaculum fulvum]|uniref:Putative thymidine phosphorylase n=1 Tax=Thalassobaculum fulvum TaxID=1633335 RepID=A0A918XX08_9PROT|nr:thymidine phosphorylase family protein [Thalassobaculum fulvum]GHD60513.1 putative thymidine phosphorylase [Thalassobaculum fulvum]
MTGPSELPGAGSHRGLRVRRLGIDTHQEAVVYMRQDCPVCRAEGFLTHPRVRVRSRTASAIATINQVVSGLLRPLEVGLSESAWQRLGVAEGDEVFFSHPAPLDSLSLLRAKIYGSRFGDRALATIIGDIGAGRYSDIHLASFITACAARGLDDREMLELTRAMVASGDRLDWGAGPVVDKHCVGGLPGNRTTPIVVSIVAACGLTMPKTSSRAITSPAGTADTMETMAPVDLDLPDMRRVVEQEGGCVVWGGAVRLSPIDDTLIRVERALDIDSEGQLVASVLSKKAAAGSTHLVLDLPVGPTAKVRSDVDAARLEAALTLVGTSLGMRVRCIRTDGRQPVGRGIGPALEARDVLAVLQDRADAPADLRDRALALAGALLELGGAAAAGAGAAAAGAVLADGRAWRKFQAICEAQGGMRMPPVAAYRHPVTAAKGGRVTGIDNRAIAKAAKLAGAPSAKAAGLDLHVRLNQTVAAGEPLFTLHAESQGELDYALDYVSTHPLAVRVEEA